MGQPRTSSESAPYGVFGGSFDPVHNGHLRLADSLLKRAPLQGIGLMPTFQSPLKPSHQASPEHRKAMLKLALKPHPKLELLTHEIERSTTSYTIDTLCALQKASPARNFCWIIGADAVASLPQWRGIHELVKRTRFYCLKRAGYPERRPENLSQAKLIWLETPSYPIASSTIRAQLAKGEKPAAALPEAVLNYILHHGLYQVP